MPQGCTSHSRCPLSLQGTQSFKSSQTTRGSGCARGRQEDEARFREAAQRPTCRSQGRRRVAARRARRSSRRPRPKWPSRSRSSMAASPAIRVCVRRTRRSRPPPSRPQAVCYGRGACEGRQSRRHGRRQRREVEGRRRGGRRPTPRPRGERAAGRAAQRRRPPQQWASQRRVRRSAAVARRSRMGCSSCSDFFNKPQFSKLHTPHSTTGAAHP